MIRSGGRAISSQMASLTLSAGDPSTIQPRVEPSSSSTCLTTKGVSSVIVCATPLCSRAGATTVTSPRHISSLRRARSPGANTPSSLVRSICIVFTYAQGEAQVFEPGQTIDRRQAIGSEFRFPYDCGPILYMAIVTALADQRQPEQRLLTLGLHRGVVSSLGVSMGNRRS